MISLIASKSHSSISSGRHFWAYDCLLPFRGTFLFFILSIACKVICRYLPSHFYIRVITPPRRHPGCLVYPQFGGTSLFSFLLIAPAHMCYGRYFWAYDCLPPFKRTLLFLILSIACKGICRYMPFQS